MPPAAPSLCAGQVGPGVDDDLWRPSGICSRGCVTLSCRRASSQVLSKSTAKVAAKRNKGMPVGADPVVHDEYRAMACRASRQPLKIIPR